MARPLRIEFPGAVYHITSRGNAKQAIFLDDKDRTNFLEILDSVVKRFNWLCHAYCLMDNHYHLLIETPEGNLCKGMRQLNGVYTQKFNKRHNRVGHLFQGRYKAILVEKESYLLTLCRYVVLNPVRAGLVKHPREWQWSSYRATAGEEKAFSFLTIDWILSQFDSRKKIARKQYKQFILNGIGEKFPWDVVKGQLLLGNENFIKKFNELLKDKEKIKEIPRIQRYAARPSLNELFMNKKIMDKKLKDEIIYLAHIHYGYTLKEIAEYLNVHYATVSRVIKRIEGKSKK